MSETLSDIVQQLRTEEKTVMGEIAGLKAKIAEKEKTLKRIQDGIKALGQKPNGKSSRKPAASKADVITFIEAVLREHAPLEDEELRKLVEKQVAAAGKSRMGLALRVKEALEDERFVDSPGGYRLADGSEPATATASLES